MGTNDNSTLSLHFDWESVYFKIRDIRGSGAHREVSDELIAKLGWKLGAGGW